MIVYRQFRIEDVVVAAARGWLLPGGLTRSVISPRPLRVNYPLQRPVGDQPMTAKQVELEAWLRLRMEGRHVRFHAEATLLFDE